MTKPSSPPTANGKLVLSRLAQEGLECLQLRIERFYELESAPSIVPFIVCLAHGSRERVLVQQQAAEVGLRVQLPEESLRALAQGHSTARFDALLEAVEGVSHFVHLSERARTELPTTLLELELQAEVDKFLFLATTGQWNDWGESFHSPVELRTLHHRLYERVTYLHSAHSELGARYRLANDLAAKLWSKLLTGPKPASVTTLRRFYRAGQTEKIAMVCAA